MARYQYMIGTHEEIDELVHFLVNGLGKSIDWGDDLQVYGIDDERSGIKFKSPFLTRAGYEKAMGWV